MELKAQHTNRKQTLVLIGLLVLLPASARLVEGVEAPVPELARWEANMLSHGRTLCDALAQPLPLEQLLSEIHYDAERVFYQIADYTGDTTWITCAQRAERIYRDLYVLPNNGSVPGYGNFTDGLAMDYLRSGDAVSRQVAILLSENAAFAADSTPLEWTASADYSREVAFTILSYLDAEKLGEPPRARLAQLVDQALGHIDQWFVASTATRIAPFMVGLTAESLIRYYEHSPDPRIPPAIRLAMDWLWTYAWLPAAEAFWYDSLDTSVAAPDLNLLIAPAYAWLYLHTGDPAYRDRGDQVFAGGVRLAQLGSGKQFNQNYRSSFDYVRWRTAGSSPPELDRWEANMLGYGAAHCDRLAEALPPEDLLFSVQYDAERVFYQIAEYTGDAAWITCAQRAEAVYRDRYVLPNNGGVPGYWNFTHGLALNYLRAGDSLSKDAVILLSQNAAFAPDWTPLEWTASADYSREVSSAILSYLDAEAMGEPPRARLAPLVDQALGHIDQWFVSRTATYIAPFIVGLAAEALIRYYEHTPDPRIPPAIEQAVNWLWTNAWLSGSEAFWYDSLNTSVAAPDHSLLIAPAYAWLYHHTGHPAHRNRGDQVFAGGVKFAWLAGGKQFNQGYRWSFDYLKWRAEPPASPAP